MSQFSEIVKESAIRYPSGTGRRFQAFGHAKTPQGGNTRRHARNPRHPSNARGPKAGTPFNLADMLSRKWGGPTPHASGHEFDAVAEKVTRKATPSAGMAGLRKGALSWMEGKAVPALLTGTLGVGSAVVGKEYVAPWITKKLSPKQTMMQKLLSNPNARKMLLAGAGAAALGGGVAIGENIHRGVSDEIGKRRAFKRLVTHSPHLVKQDPKHTAELFGALYTFNKDLAKNPLTASSFIKTRLHYKDEGLQPTDIKTLVEIGKNHRESKAKDSFLSKTFGQSATLSGMSGLGIGSPPGTAK